MNLFDKILEEEGIKYEDLNMAERETYRAKSFDVKTISIGDVKENIITMLKAIALQLCDQPVVTEEDKFKDAQLKARLKNYILQEAFLSSPEKAEQALRNAIKNLKTK